MKHLLFGLVVLALFIGTATAANVSLTIQSQTVAPGGTVTVPIAASGASSIGAMDLTLTYDASVLKFISADIGALSKNGMVEANGTTPGSVRIAFVDSSGVNGDGPVIVVRFTAIGASGTSSKVDLQARGVYTLDHVDIPASVQGGTVSVGGGSKTPLPAVCAITAVVAAAIAVFARRKARK
jgi:hypothetical protein